MKSSVRSMIVTAGVVALLFSFTMMMAAQDEAVRAAYASSGNIPTTIEGIHRFPAAPASFDPLTATDLTLATYGFPPRPDKNVDAAGYAKWARAMKYATKRWDGELKPTQIYHGPMQPAKAPAAALAQAPASVSNTATLAYSGNWSGFVNTNTLHSYSTKTSYYYIYSYYNVPVAQQTPGTCDGGWDYGSAWNGIDGWNSGDVLQAGVEFDAYCSGSTTATFYSAWIEWYPYSETRVYGVNPGDDMFVETVDTSSVAGYVYVEDVTQGIFDAFDLTPPSGTALVGNSAEFVVERPGVGGGLATLTDYVYDFWADNNDYTFKGAHSYPGSTSSKTYNVEMVQGGDVVSYPTAEGDYGIFFVYE